MSNPNDGTIDNFLTFFDPANASYGQSANLVHLFSPDNPGPPAVVGITNHADPQQALGPVFTGQAAIQNLFQTVFGTFNPFKLDSWPPRTYSTDQQSTALRVAVTAKQVGLWFQQPDPAHSLPLSALSPVPQPFGGPNQSLLPACLFFSFDNNHKISQLAIYMDRYRLMRELQPTDRKNKFDPAMTHFLAALRPGLAADEKQSLLEALTRVMDLQQ